jgi:N utilization substance protein A
MKRINLIETFADFKEAKNIDRATLVRIIQDVFLNLLSKKYGTSDNFEVIVNDNTGDLEIYRSREIVEDDEVEDPVTQVGISEAIKIEPDFEVGEEIEDEIKFNEFGRRDIINIRQYLVSKILELENSGIYNKYKEKIGEIVVGEVYQIWKREMLIIDDDGLELILPAEEQIPKDRYRKGDSIRAVVLKVEMRNNQPQIILSRTAPALVERLFEQEVPEIYDGLITIHKVVRIPGERAKVAVESYDDRIDPVGACVGMKGSRIHGIVRELGNESIDVVNFTNNLTLLIARSLSPAKISSVKLDEENKKADVFLKPDQVSLAIGKGGYNIRLASELTGFTIDVYRELEADDEDVDLQEFSDEIDQWILDELKNIGCDTAKSVLDLTTSELVKRTDLEEETIIEVRKILKEEFS